MKKPKKPEPPYLTKEAFFALLAKAAQPIPQPPAQEAEQTSESDRPGD